MALKGVREPVTGVKGAKGPTRLREPKVPRQPETETSVALGEEYLRKRNQILDLKFKREAMNLAFARDQLIEQELAIKQLSYLVISMRQKLLAIPRKLYSRLGPERFPREAAQECERCIHEVLNELAKLPECAEPDWLERLEEYGSHRLRWGSGHTLNRRRFARYFIARIHRTRYGSLRNPFA